MKIENRIKQYKNKLIKKALKTGLYENFGDLEERKLREEFKTGYMGEERKNMDLIDSFFKWRISFDDNDLKEVV